MVIMVIFFITQIKFRLWNTLKYLIHDSDLMQIIRKSRVFKKPDTIPQEQTLLHNKYGNLVTENDLIEKASMFLDVIHGRDFKMHRNGKLPKKVHKFFNLKWTRYFLIFICLLWLFCIQFEPPSTIYDTNPKTTQYKHIINILIFEWIVFVILLIECLLRFYSFGRKWFFKDHLLHKMRVLLFIY
eukprot:11431_1